MIAFLKGILAGKSTHAAFVEVQGVGYAVGMSQAALSRLPEVGSSVLIHTYLQMREDGVSLFGFLTLEEKALFERLISVSGVGPKVALSALSSFTSQVLVRAIASQDVAAIQQIPGVGKKTASRIILELQGALDQELLDLENKGTLPSESENIKRAKEVLLSMEFTSAEVELALKDAPQGMDENRLLQYALKRIGS